MAEEDNKDDASAASSDDLDSGWGDILGEAPAPPGAQSSASHPVVPAVAPPKAPSVPGIVAPPSVPNVPSVAKPPSVVAPVAAPSVSDPAPPQARDARDEEPEPEPEQAEDQEPEPEPEPEQPEDQEPEPEPEQAEDPEPEPEPEQAEDQEPEPAKPDKPVVRTTPAASRQRPTRAAMGPTESEESSWTWVAVAAIAIVVGVAAFTLSGPDEPVDTHPKVAKFQPPEGYEPPPAKNKNPKRAEPAAPPSTTAEPEPAVPPQPEAEQPDKPEPSVAKPAPKPEPLTAPKPESNPPITGDAEEAYKQAKRAYAGGTKEAAGPMTLAACEMHDGGKARSAFRKMASGTARKEARTKCKALGIDLLIKDKGSTAEEMLMQARRAAKLGDHQQAYKLANKSNKASRSNEALTIMGEMACELGRDRKAKHLAGMLRADRRERIESACSAKGIEI